MHTRAHTCTRTPTPTPTHTHTHTHTHTPTHTHAHPRTHTHTHTHTRTHTHTHPHTCTHTRTPTHTHAHTHAHTRTGISSRFSSTLQNPSKAGPGVKINQLNQRLQIWCLHKRLEGCKHLRSSLVVLMLHGAWWYFKDPFPGLDSLD